MNQAMDAFEEALRLLPPTRAWHPASVRRPSEWPRRPSLCSRNAVRPPDYTGSAAYGMPSERPAITQQRWRWTSRFARCGLRQGGEPLTQPYGWWTPAVSAAEVAHAGVSIDAVSIGAGGVYWIEGRADSDVLVRWTASHGRRDVLPPGTEPASSVHKYGGGAHLPAAAGVWFVRSEDQRICRTAGAAVVPI